MTAGHGDHSDLWNYIDGLREDLGKAEERIAALEASAPQARQLQYEADVAGADAREYDRHSLDCQCPYCYHDPAEDSPGSAAGGVS